MKFNAALCRCAIIAAQAHEADAFGSCANSNRYHAAMMCKHPALKFIPHDRLAALCSRFGQPCPELPAAAQEREATVSQAAVASAPPKQATEEVAAASATEQVRVRVLESENAADESTANRPDAGGSGAPGPFIEACDPAEQQQCGQRDGGVSGAEPTDEHVSATHSTDAGADVDVLFRELFGDGDDDGDGASAAHVAGSDAAECEKPDRTSDVQEHAMRDESKQAVELEQRELAGDGTKAEPGNECSKGPEMGEDHVVEPCGPHPDDDFQEFVRTRKRARKAHDGDGGEVGDVQARAGRASDAGAQVRLEVQKYVGELLEPWLKGGSINVRQFTDILGRVVEKIVGAHPNAKDAGFLEGHATSIRKLVDRYVNFTLKR